MANLACFVRAPVKMVDWGQLAESSRLAVSGAETGSSLNLTAKLLTSNAQRIGRMPL